MKAQDPISNIMRTDIVTLESDATFADLKKLLKSKPFHHIPVVEGQKLLGMLSTTDVLNQSTLEDSTTLFSMMQKPVTCLLAKQTMTEAAGILFESPFNALPVVDEDNHLIGLVTSKDFVKWVRDFG